MGKPDTVTYEYMKHNEVFADAFNFLLYNGNKVIDYNELKELDTRTIAYIYNEAKGKKADKAIQKYRDIFKQAIVKQDDKATYVLLGIENQTDIHYAMPVRNMIYDALSYDEQVSAIEKYNRDNKLTDFNGHYLSGFLKSDKLLPVITLVVYFGADKWDGPLTLHEMLDTDNDVVLKYTQNYRINLIEPYVIDEEELKMFSSDLGRVLSIIKYSKDRDRFKQFVLGKEELILSKEAGNVIENVTSIKIPDNLKDGDKEIDMCLALREIIEEEKAIIIKES
ncbi:MAG: Rpn family recombination-promoting nuclease/putative transposase, partial [Erysipelotrichaceae bacterium]